MFDRRSKLGGNIRHARGRKTCVRFPFYSFIYLFIYLFIHLLHLVLSLLICLFIHFSFSAFNSWCALYSRETIVHKPLASR